jgi:hypothetical protein
VVDVGLPRSCTPRHRSYRFRLASAPRPHLAMAGDVIKELLDDATVTGHEPLTRPLERPATTSALSYVLPLKRGIAAVAQW